MKKKLLNLKWQKPNNNCNWLSCKKNT